MAGGQSPSSGRGSIAPCSRFPTGPPTLGSRHAQKLRKRFRFSPDALVLLKLKRTHSPVRRTMQTHDSERINAGVAQSLGTLLLGERGQLRSSARTFAHITADKPSQPPSAAAYPSVRSAMRRPSAVRPLTGRRRGSFVIRERLFIDLGMVAKRSTTRFSSKTLPLHATRRSQVSLVHSNY